MLSHVPMILFLPFSLSFLDVDMHAVVAVDADAVDVDVDVDVDADGDVNADADADAEAVDAAGSRRRGRRHFDLVVNPPPFLLLSESRSDVTTPDRRDHP